MTDAEQSKIAERKHTPLPWGDYLATIITGHTVPHRQWQILGPDSFLVCDLPEIMVGETPIRDANAAFIVRACNSHYKLVEALQGAIRFLVTPGGFPDKGMGRTDQQQRAFNAVRAAIAAATEQEQETNG